MRAIGPQNLMVFGELQNAGPMVPYGNWPWGRALFTDTHQTGQAFVFSAGESLDLDAHGGLAGEMVFRARLRDFMSALAQISQQGSQEERQEAHNLPMREFDSRPCDPYAETNERFLAFKAEPSPFTPFFATVDTP